MRKETETERRAVVIAFAVPHSVSLTTYSPPQHGIIG